jgi:hypothetical protein
MLYSPLVLRPFCLKAPCQRIHLNLRPLVLGLRTIDCKRYTTLIPPYSITYHHIVIDLRPLLYAHFFRKTRT